MCAAGKDRVLLSSSATKEQIFHAIYVVKFGRVHVAIEDNDVQVFGYGAIVLWGFGVSGTAPIPERAEGRVVEGDEDLAGARGLGFIQPGPLVCVICSS